MMRAAIRLPAVTGVWKVLDLSGEILWALGMAVLTVMVAMPLITKML